ncbi:MAG: flagellar filament capping protein FliD [Deltaproteobacteria bacterium]|nr:flagellar filament capping protein FliD [Deltaproteobacteria bacterium]
MSISVGGLVSGMDTDKIISQLQELQKKPITKLQTQEAAYQVKLSAYSSLKGSLNDLKNAAKNLDSVSDITSFSATSSNTSLLTASAEKTAVAGSYSVTVNSLATAQKLTSTGFTESEAVGKGTIHLTFGSNDPVDIAVNSGSTISDIATAINKADTGIYASVINDGTKSYLTLTGKQTGSANVIKLTVTEDGTDTANLPVGVPSADEDTTGLSRLVYDAGGAKNLTQLQGAANADISVDGVTHISRASNTISDVINGVTLKLKEADTSKTVTVEVERSDDLLTTRLNAFLDAYNGLMNSLDSLQSYDKETKETGTLFGDSTTRRIQSEVRNLFTNSVSGLSADSDTLTELGVSTNDDGDLELDSTVFSAKLKDNFDNVVKFFTKTDTGAKGFAVRMASSMETMVGTKGLLATRTDGIQNSIDDIDDQVTRLNDRLSVSETRLRTQFSALEVLLGQYQNTSSSLTSNLDALANGWGTGN